VTLEQIIAALDRLDGAAVICARSPWTPGSDAAVVALDGLADARRSGLAPFLEVSAARDLLAALQQEQAPARDHLRLLISSARAQRIAEWIGMSAEREPAVRALALELRQLTPDALAARVLAENDFAETADAFVASGAPCWTIDRHVVDPGIDPIDEPFVAATCHAARALAREWDRRRAPYLERGLLVSRPSVIIDDEWLAGARNAPPPHVLVTFARDKAVELED
jgi:hypothetical protein